MRKIVGLNISLQKTGVCILSRDGQLVWQGQVDCEPDRSSKGFSFGETTSIW